MTRVDFYISNEQGEHSRLAVTARIAEKAYRQGRRVFINACSSDQAESLDALLWTSKPANFVPHGLITASEAEPVVIGWGQEPSEHDDVLINLSLQAPAFFSRFERVAEVVTQEHDHLEALRAAWRFYKDRGYPLQKYDV